MKKLLALLKSDSGTGILLIIFTILALVFANSGLSNLYEKFLNFPVHLTLGELKLHKPLILWINDGLMAIFFFLVGLELKRERVSGELREMSRIILPAVGALGGMAVPALIYLVFNAGNPDHVNGWAIPAATDIAFALGVLSLLGSRVPLSLKVFLTSVAIFDDIGAIIIIALFYTSKMSLGALGIALLTLPVLFLMNRKKVQSSFAYFLVGLVLWTALLKSGVHATLGGVITALFIPINPQDTKKSMLHHLEHNLHYWVSFAVLPIFAFANAGVPVLGMAPEQIIHPVTLGVALGLILGKPIGVAGSVFIYKILSKKPFPEGMNTNSLIGLSLLCGIGFTMSIFIGSLAFTGLSEKLFDERLGILIGSLLSGILGYIVLNKALKKAL